jgi:tetrahydromethanopterin S-methyltransferase subunit B
MANPWFDPGMYAWIPGTVLGVIGGVIGGPLAGVFAPRGKLKKFVVGFFFATLIMSAVFLITGLIAYFSDQPYGVWYGLGFPGLLGLIIFSALIFVVLNRYREAELRKTMAKDI